MYEFNLKQFSYSKDTKTLIGDNKQLHITTQPFIITNYKTNKSQQFRLVNNTKTYYLFISKENIKCLIKK